MAEDIRWQQRFSNYCKALDRLEDFLEPPALNEREQQGLIKAFEYTYDLAWNTLRDLLRSQGDVSLLGSRDTLREAFRLGLIEHGETWMLMLQDRNLTSHTYNRATADAIAAQIISIATCPVFSSCAAGWSNGFRRKRHKHPGTGARAAPSRAHSTAAG
jgi:nucleotidyltransferase substrate binding protein (TIGR01987 family)